MEEFLDQESIDVPKSFLNIWMDYLSFSNNNNMLSLLFQKLLHAYRMENENVASLKFVTLRNKFLLAWINTLTKLNSYKNG